MDNTPESEVISHYDFYTVHKMHGLGNDFVVLDNRNGDLEIKTTNVSAIADRRIGVGFDQLLVIEPAKNPKAQVFMRILNPDGSEAEACGNGTRCVAAQIMSETGQDNANIETVAGILETNRTSENVISVDMGKAELTGNISLIRETRYPPSRHLKWQS